MPRELFAVALPFGHLDEARGVERPPKSGCFTYSGRGLPVVSGMNQGTINPRT